jgi:hypothetical protein
MKKKLADTFDKNGTPINKGDLVFFNLWSVRSSTCEKIVLGKIKRIDGAYIFVQNVKNKKDISELYSTEIEKASDEKAMLWMFENVMDV